jgi:hypothetical protein
LGGIIVSLLAVGQTEMPLPAPKLSLKLNKKLHYGYSKGIDKKRGKNVFE